MKTTVRITTTAALAALALALVPASLQAKVIKVPSGAIQTIQQGVDAAAPGDTVMVRPGTYVCDDVTDYWPPAVYIGADKPGLRLKTTGAPGSVKIVGPGYGTGSGIWIGAANASVEGFDISGFWKGIAAGEQAPDTQTRIIGNTIHCFSFIEENPGICMHLAGSCNYEVAHNTLADGGIGIFLTPPQAPGEAGPNPQHHLHHNRVTSAQGDGMRLDHAPGSVLDHNVCDNNGWTGPWGGAGIFLTHSPNSTVDHNQTDSNFHGGIGMQVSEDCAVTGNEANNNFSFGIYVWGECCGSSFKRNVAEGNGTLDLLNGDPPTCSTYLNNQAGTAYPSLDVWDVKASQ